MLVARCLGRARRQKEETLARQQGALQGSCMMVLLIMP